MSEQGPGPAAGAPADPPANAQRRRARRDAFRRRKSFYAIAASEGEILIPRPEALGYLQQSKLIRAAQAGDLDAWRRVWAQHSRLAFTVVNRYRVRPDQVADAIQDSQIGLARAIQKFEIERLHEFSTYAFHWLRQAVQRHRHYNMFRVRLPEYLFYSYMEFSSRVAGAASRSEWFDERDRWLDRDPQRYECMVRIHAVAAPELLTRDCPNLDDGPTAIDRLIADERHTVIWECLGKLEPREREVLCRRHGLDDQPEETLDEIGVRLRVTRERIRQIQLNAEADLRKHLADRGFGGEGPREERPPLRRPRRLSSPQITIPTPAPSEWRLSLFEP